MHQVTFIALCLVLLAAAVRSAEPSGAYCGSYSFGLVTGKVIFDSSAHTFDLSFNGLGADIKCLKEAYVYHSDTGAVEVVDLTKPSDCLGSVISGNGLSLTATYNSADDAVALDLGLASLTATRC